MIGLLLAAIYAVSAAGENCQNPTSVWDKHTCLIIADVDKYQRKCIPTRVLPPPGVPVKGLIVLAHGWTGCPDAYDQISAELSSQGFIALTPLLPGQGININYGCDVAGACVQNGTNPSYLPISKQPYIEFSEFLALLANDELSLLNNTREELTVGVMGLSGGGPLAAYAATRPGNPFTKVVVGNIK
jgi:alpha-beta hydrolase superfamily lysophospholipase